MQNGKASASEEKNESNGQVQGGLAVASIVTVGSVVIVGLVLIIVHFYIVVLVIGVLMIVILISIFKIINLIINTQVEVKIMNIQWLLRGERRLEKSLR